MREIKFRCFYRGKMYPVLEMCGYTMRVSSIEMFIEELGCTRNVSPDQEHIKGVMQYTGLKDKNGKEIYEGDIIEAEFDGDLIKGSVFYGEVSFDVDCDYDPECNILLFLQANGIGEVIGNIHENPELL